MENTKNKDWRMDKHLVIMRLCALAIQMRECPDKITDDPIGRIKLNKIGKAFSELVNLLRYHEGELRFTEEEIKNMNWYDSVIQYFKEPMKERKNNDPNQFQSR